MPEALIVEPFVRQDEGDEVVIGLPDRGTFLALPRDAVDLLDALAAGRSAAEVKADYRREHGVEPDLDGLLDELARRGFVRRQPSDASAAAPSGAPGDALASAPAAVPALRSAHFAWLPRPLARALWSRPVVALCGLAIVAASLLMLLDPHLRPSARTAFFEERTIAFLGLLMLIGLVSTFFHEMAHLLAAHARGVSCRFGIGNRMWFVVWETDMTGIWALPRRERYLPILAGVFADLTGGALLVLVHAAAARGVVELSPTTLQMVRAVVFIYAMRIAWQLYMFLRTDFYYAFANLFGCRNLMADARADLAFRARRLIARATGAPPALPAGREGRAVRLYSWLWLAGRALAFSILVFVQLPLFFLYIHRFGQILAGNDAGTDLAEVLTSLLFVLFLTWGFALWIREIWRSRRKETAT